MRRHTSVSSAALAGLLLLAAAAPASATTEFTPVGDRALASSTWVHAINDHGEVVGQTHGGLGTHAFVSDRTGLTRLAEPEDFFADAVDVNVRGTIVGSYVTEEDGRAHPLVWSGSKHAVTVLDVPDGSSAYGRDITDSGAVLFSSTDTGWVWARGRTTSVERLTGGARSTADKVNERGQLIGNDEPQAWLWDGSRIVLLQPLPGAYRSRVYGLSDYGTTVGLSDDGSGALTPVVWDRTGHPTALENLAPVETAGPDGVVAPASGWAVAVNARGDIVGQSCPSPVQECHAVAWRAHRPVVDLGAGSADDIDVKGNVVGLRWVDDDSVGARWSPGQIYRSR